MPYHFRCFGLHFASELPFSEFFAEDKSHSDVDVAIHCGETPIHLPASRQLQQPYQYWEGKTGECLLTVQDVARYYIVNGNSITIQPNPHAHPDYLRLFLFGSAFGALLHQRGYLPLHGSAVQMPDGRAAVFLGKPGAGKSTLAAALCLRGHTPLSDDISPLRKDAGGALWMYPGLPQHKLGQKLLTELCLDPATTRKVRPGVEKYFLSMVGSGLMPAPLGMLYELKPSDTTKVEMDIMPFQNITQLEIVTRHTYRAGLALQLGQNANYLPLLGAVANRVPITRIKRPRETWSLPACVERIEADWQQAGTL
ncbi:MAG: HPr kinase [Candidatus Brocadiaceae bacterium]|nr:HPr kinase [Candidatus Brocadiaceae bacterium]